MFPYLISLFTIGNSCVYGCVGSKKYTVYNKGFSLHPSCFLEPTDHWIVLYAWCETITFNWKGSSGRYKEAIFCVSWLGDKSLEHSWELCQAKAMHLIWKPVSDMGGRLNYLSCCAACTEATCYYAACMLTESHPRRGGRTRIPSSDLLDCLLPSPLSHCQISTVDEQLRIHMFVSVSKKLLF